MKSRSDNAPQPTASAGPPDAVMPSGGSPRFILVRCTDQGTVWPQWRATAHDIDVFFYQPSEQDAKDLIRTKYPDCRFSDEMVH